jgi:hypothetical protein
MDFLSFEKGLVVNFWLAPAALVVVYAVRLLVRSRRFALSATPENRAAVVSDRRKLILWAITTLVVAAIVYGAEPYLMSR